MVGSWILWGDSTKNNIIYAYYLNVLRDHHSNVLRTRRAPASHFHAYYNEYKATVDIRTGAIIEGNLPGRQTKLVVAWAELHQEELMADWQLVMSGEEPFKIQPLQ
jgi:hypothetical protein